MANTDLASSAMTTTRVIFLHHSVGADILKDGDVRGLLARQAPSVELWDYAYNPLAPHQVAKQLVKSALGRGGGIMPPHFYGLRDGSGRRVTENWQIPWDNTDPWGLADLFKQARTSPPVNAFSRMLGFDAIAFKPCFTVLHLDRDEQLEEYKQHYRTISDRLDQHPDKLFLPLTPPPLRASETTPEQAARARAFANWIMSAEFTRGRAHVRPFDLFDVLASPDGAAGGAPANTLRPEFCRPDPTDSHPNATANRRAAERWVAHIANAVRQAAIVRANAATR